MPEATETKKPVIDGFKIKGKLKGKISNIVSALQSITFIEIAQEKNAVNIAYVESRDINKNPYLFSIIKIKEDEVEVIYSITPEISPTKRRMDIIRYLLNILSLIGDDYEVDSKILLQIIDEALKKVTQSISLDYSKLYTEYDALKKEVADLKKKNERLTQQVDALTSQNYELKSENDQLKIRVEQLEKMSDEALKVKVQNWIIEHNGTINLPEFCKTHNVPESRVEEILNQLVSEGYLVAVD
jgi:regulator of replication initiation timing